MVFSVADKVKLEEMSNREKRQYLQEQCGLSGALKQREAVQLGDLPLHLEVYSAKVDDPVIIFLPGIGTYSELYANFLLEFSQRGYNMVSVDIRGHGYSGGKPEFYTVEEVIKDLCEVVEYCRERFNPAIHLWGNSLGAVLGLAAIEEIRAIKSIICHTLCTASYPPSYIHWQGWQNLNAWKWFMPWQKLNFGQFIDIKRQMQGTPFVDYIEHDDLMVWEYSIGTLADVYNYSHRAVYKQQPFKMALIVGENDTVLNLDYAKYLAAEMVHPVELISIKNACHMLPFTHIKETIDASVKWLKSNTN